MSSQPRRSLIWRQPEHPGEPELLRGIASAAAPVLPGFSLATIAVLLTESDTPPLSDWAVAAFVVAAATLVFAMQADFHALRYSVPPAARLDALPEARTDRTRLDMLRRMQNQDVVLAERYGVVGRSGYNLGLLFFFAGLALLTYPDDWRLATGAAFGAAVVAFFLEARWIVRADGLAGLATLLTTAPIVLTRRDLARGGLPRLDELDEYSIAALTMTPASDGANSSAPRTTPTTT